jgi:O-antigen/teichoic acid export membrane protein
MLLLRTWMLVGYIYIIIVSTVWQCYLGVLRKIQRQKNVASFEQIENITNHDVGRHCTVL